MKICAIWLTLGIAFIPKYDTMCVIFSKYLDIYQLSVYVNVIFGKYVFALFKHFSSVFVCD